MNTGLVDAMVLGQALTAVIHEGAPLSILDDYAAMRRAAAAEVLALASRLARIATVRSVLVRRLRNFVLRLLNRIPRFKTKLALQLSGISRRNLSLLSRASSESIVNVNARPTAMKEVIGHA